MGSIPITRFHLGWSRDEGNEEVERSATREDHAFNANQVNTRRVSRVDQFGTKTNKTLPWLSW